MQADPMYLSDDLERIVRHAYRRFSASPPADLAVCTFCCMPPEVEKRILLSPQNSISENDLSEWHSAAFSRENAKDAVLWMLPRTLDFLAQDKEDAFGVGPEVALRRIEESGLLSGMRRREQDSLLDFSKAYIEARMIAPEPRLDETFCMLSKSGQPLAPILAHLDTLPVSTLARGLIGEFGDALPLFGANAFWDDSDWVTQINHFFARPELYDRFLTRALEDDGPNTELMFKAADLIGHLSPAAYSNI